MDQDCNGFSNENDPNLVLSGPEYDYQGPSGTVNRGICRAGHRECSGGREELIGEVLPTEELCDQIDNDCDGLVDEDLDTGAAAAFAIVLDYSGSMTNTISSVQNAVCDWATNFNYADSKFAIIAVADYYAPVPYITLITDFVSAADACFAFLYTGDPGGAEYLPWATIGLNEDQPWAINWPAGLNKKVILFSDEPAQPFSNNLAAEYSTIQQQCFDHTLEIGVFANSANASTWQGMTIGHCNGWIENLSQDAIDMRQKLEVRFGGRCLPPQQ
jgi:hypothetical protein